MRQNTTNANMQTKPKTTFVSGFIGNTITGLLLQAYMTQCLQFEVRFTIQRVLLSQLARGKEGGGGVREEFLLIFFQV